MDTILDTTKVFCIMFVLFITDRCCMGKYFFLFCSCQVIALTYFFGKMAPVTAIMDAISLLFSAMDNDLLHAYGHSPADKIEEHITFALSHANLYLFE